MTRNPKGVWGMQALGTTKVQLRNLLEYTSELLALKEKVIRDLHKEAVASFYEHNVAGLEGVEVNVDSDTWIRISRLRETRPPEPPPLLADWVSFGAHPSPDEPPKLKSSRMLTLPIEEISDLAEAGLITGDDVMRPVGADQAIPDKMDIFLRIERLTEIKQAYDAYLSGPWKKWAETEKPRRRSIDFYNKVYQIHQRMISLGDDTPIELVFGLGIARWLYNDHRIDVPLIEQLAEIELFEDGTLVVRPRNLPPQLVLKAFHELEVEGSKAVQKAVGDELARIAEDPDIGFSPFEKRSYEKLLKTCVARLSASGVYQPEEKPDDRTLPPIDQTLRVTDTWVVYARQRSSDARREDIARLINRVERAKTEEDLPAPAIRFVVPPSDRVIHADSDIDLTSATLDLPDSYLGPRSSGGGGSASAAGDSGVAGSSRPGNRALFFPLPYNDDQEEIIGRLDDDACDGLVVQGPPGTGKTHTIANIICHFLATQRRVLVTAKTPEALQALQEKIPEGIRELAISVIHHDREGAQQLQEAVRVLADEARSINVREVEAAIVERNARLLQLRQTIRKVDAELEELAKQNMRTVTYGGAELDAMTLAARVNADRAQHAWFPDALTLESQHEPRFTDNDIATAGRLRRKLGIDLAYSRSDLPDPSILPELPRVIAAHGDLVREREIEAAARSGRLPVMRPEPERARKLRDWLKEFRALFDELEKEPWLVDAWRALIGVRRMETDHRTAVQSAFETWSDLFRRGRTFEIKALSCHHEDDAAFDKALQDLSEGRNPFGIFSFGKGSAKAKVEACKYEGRKPTTVDEWIVIRQYRTWQKEGKRFIGRWEGIARAVSFGSLPSDWEQGKSDFLRIGRVVERIFGLHRDIDVYHAEIKALFPYDVDPDEVLHHGRCDKLLEAIEANLEKADMVAARRLKEQLDALPASGDLPFQASLRLFRENLGNANITREEITEAWSSILGEAQRLASLVSDIEALDAIVAKVAASGAANWAQELRYTPPEGEDKWTPANWRAAWEWARVDGFLSTLGDRRAMTMLSEERAEAEASQRRIFAELIRLRTLLGLKKSLSDRILAALQKFTAAIARLGKGTGKAAGRHRRIIRESAIEAADAVPCWILPEWRVAEQLPAELAKFDLVIVDEASQSDITAFPAIMRGKKVLIVGDDKQVSPSAVAVQDRVVVHLKHTYLADQPFGDQMEPTTSLYELGGMVYPGKVVILREHFRCVEPIIRFSADNFYGGSLVPLRLPKASERIDPPLVDIYVPHGRKKGDLNTAEAEVIVGEIAKLVTDPTFAKRTIGVISLIGTAQANYIYKRLIAELGTEIVERHHIMCGNAATFQGQERDIVFLSMVACPETATAFTVRTYAQRFNVAASRARDRLVLVRSVAASDLRPDDLKLRLIEHFANPMKGGSLVKPKDVLDLCESGFEREFGRVLLDLGYRIRPQVPVGGYRIDFVVEGANDRRLAIELDGDNYHGPDRWAADMRRQRALERLGWTFWRCWGSSWVRDREGCIADLKETLARLGIEPIGMGELDIEYTLHVEVPPPAPEAAQEVPPAAPAASVVDAALSRPTDHAPVYSGPSSSAEGMPEDEEPVFTDLEGVTADVGDLVAVRYLDNPDRLITIELSDRANRPDEGIIHVREPLGAALLGASIDEQIEVTVNGRTRTAVVERIEKAREATLAAAE